MLYMVHLPFFYLKVNELSNYYMVGWALLGRAQPWTLA